MGVDEIVPVLESGGEVVDGFWRKDGGEGEVGQDEVVDGEVAFGGVDLGCGLIVVARVVLSGVADVDFFFVVEEVVDAAVVTLLVEWGSDGVGGNCAERDGESQFLIGEVGDRDTGAFAQALVGEETEVLVFADGSADGAAVLLTAVVGLGLSGLFADGVVGLQGLGAEEAVEGAVKLIGAGFGDDVESGAFAAAVLGGEAVGADLELLHGFEGKLHDGTADGVVLVVDTVDGGVGVASAGTVDGVDGVAIFGGVVAVDHLDAGCEDGEIGDVAAVEGKVDDLLGCDGARAVGLLHVEKLVGGVYFNRGGDGSGLHGEIGGDGGADE